MKVVHGEARRREVDAGEGVVDRWRLQLEWMVRYRVLMGSSWWRWWLGWVLGGGRHQWSVYDNLKQMALVLL
jgi:hypothetical protein